MYAIIGGSGLAKLSGLAQPRRQVVRTPYGEPSGALTFGTLAGREVVFLARHGYGHTIAPHDINYRANIRALKDLGVAGVFAVATVGAIRTELAPASLVVPHQIIDYTWGRKSTFFEGAEAAVTHVDFTQPYSKSLREQLLEAARRCAEPVIDGAVYACTQGPRLETAAEIERLAREAGLDYAALAVVVNHAAGRGDSQLRIRLEQLQVVMDATVVRAVRILEHALRELP